MAPVLLRARAILRLAHRAAGLDPSAGGTNRNAHAERPGSGTSVIPHRPGPDRVDALALVLATPLEGRGGRPNKCIFFRDMHDIADSHKKKVCRLADVFTLAGGAPRCPRKPTHTHTKKERDSGYLLLRGN